MFSAIRTKFIHGNNALFLLKDLVQNKTSFYRQYKQNIKAFRPKFSIFYCTDHFILKTVENPFELRQVLKLRYEIFYKELQNKTTATQLDIDHFDFICDHLIIIDRNTSKVIGTYRLISSLFSNTFYSQNEFQINHLLNTPGNKLELGRACIHKDYRTGATISLLWRGIIEYAKKTEAKILFGCASVQTTNENIASKLHQYLVANDHSSAMYNIEPTEEYNFEFKLQKSLEGAEKEIPHLLQSYIRAGAKAYGLPAFDRDFQCFDFFMILKMENLPPLFRKKFKLE